jgi:HSP20 family protein
MIEIDDAIVQIENLYKALTGTQATSTESPYAPIPPERDPVAHVQEQVDRLLQALTTPFSQMSMAGVPPISVSENGTEFVVFVDVPGVARDRLDVSLRGNMLVITGERPGPGSDGHRLRVAERTFGAFRRVLRLPAEARAAEMSARLKDGVLEVRIPRTSDAPSNARNVPVA